MTNVGQKLLSLALVCLLVVGACGGDDDDTGGDGGDDSAAGSGLTVDFSPSDGSLTTLDLESCDNPEESSIRLAAMSETQSLRIEAEGGSGTITTKGPEGDRSGTVTAVSVGDAGNVAVSGTITPGGGSDETETFEVIGQCG